MHPPVKNFRMWLLGVWMAIAAATVAQGHIVTQIPMTLEVNGDKVVGHVGADAAYMLAENRGGEDGFVPDLEWLRKLSPEEKAELKVEAEAYMRQCLEILADEAVMPWSISFPDFDSEHPAYLTEGDPSDAPVLKFDIVTDFPKEAKKLEIDWHEPFSVGLLLKIHTADGEVRTLPLRDARTAVAERGTGGDLEAHEATFPYWILMGFEHILPEGVDHIFFVLGLFLLAPKWKPLLRQTLAFTVAHSLTLAAAVLGWVHFEPRWVEVAIAASIAWVGIENLWVKELGKGRLYLVGAFGLIHGLGFASSIADKLKEQQGALAPALAGFNIGVELGQVTVLLLAFALFGWWGEKFRWVKLAGSVLVGCCGALLVVQRAFGMEVIPWM